MENTLLHAHSGLMYLVLIMLLLSLAMAYVGVSGNKIYTPGIKRLHLSTRLILTLEGIIGLALYFIKGYPQQIGNMANVSPHGKFFLLWHIIVMLIGIIICNIGYNKAMKAGNDKEKFKLIATFYSIGLLIILTAIPFPFIQSLAKWL